MRRWLGDQVNGDWLRHQLGLTCRQPVTGHEYAAPPPGSGWSGKPCIWLAHPLANRCLRPGRCHQRRRPQ